jgi:hypothetical protein
LPSAFPNHLLEVNAVVLDLLFELTLPYGALETHHHGTLPERFYKIVVGPTTHRLHSYIHVIHASGDQEDEVRIETANLGEEFHAADPRHVEIGNDGVESLMLQGFESFFAAVGSGTMKGRWAQDDGEEPRSGDLVVHCQDPNGRGLNRRLLEERSAGFARNLVLSAVHSWYPPGVTISGPKDQPSR